MYDLDTVRFVPLFPAAPESIGNCCCMTFLNAKPPWVDRWERILPANTSTLPLPISYLRTLCHSRIAKCWVAVRLRWDVPTRPQCPFHLQNWEKRREAMNAILKRTGWHIRMWRSSRWHQNKVSALAWPGQGRPGQNRTFVLKSTGGQSQPDVSPCSNVILILLNEGIHSNFGYF